MSIASYFKTLTGCVFSAWFVAFAVTRCVLFTEEHARASKHYADDLFTARLCADNNLKAGLGRHDHVCEAAVVATQVPPYQTALKRVAEQTHLCGPSPCAEIVYDLSESLNAVAFVAAMVLVLPYALNACARRRGFEQAVAALPMVQYEHPHQQHYTKKLD